jgi:hypothetical protein
MPMIKNKWTGRLWLTILGLGLLTGTLDGLAAIAMNYKIGATRIFKFIASGAFGKSSSASGTEMILWGVFFHYFIAFSFSAMLFLLYPVFISVLKNKYFCAIAFALITYIMTNLVIVPLSKIGWRPMDLSFFFMNLGILIFTIGLPIALIAHGFYARKIAKDHPD